MKNDLAICAIVGEQDARYYIQDWLSFHRALGVSHFYLYWNNQLPILTGDDLSVKPWPYSGGQIIAYNDFLNNGWKEKYCLICDIDEFLCCDDSFDLDAVDFDVMLLNWKIFGSCGETQYKPEPVWKRFKTPAPIDAVYNDELPYPVTENWHVKSVVKNNGKPKVFVNPHNCIVNCVGGKYVNAVGNECRNSPWKTPVWSGAWLNHYCTKSRGEWEARRLYKADACGNRIDTYKLERWYKNLEDSYAKEKC